MATTRTRKSAAPKKVEAPTVPARTEPNIKLSEYVADAKVRWSIHQQEVAALLKDIKTAYQSARPRVQQAYTYCVEQYKRMRPAQ
jgi:hypothetical protein